MTLSRSDSSRTRTRRDSPGPAAWSAEEAAPSVGRVVGWCRGYEPELVKGTVICKFLAGRVWKQGAPDMPMCFAAPLAPLHAH